MSLVLFISGASSLIFEVVWFDRSGLVFGNSAVATTLVLSSFMAGLAVGNLLAPTLGARHRSRLRCYAALLTVVAISGIAATYVLRELVTPMTIVAQFVHRSPDVLNVARFVGAFVVLIIPTSAMGATLPIIVSDEAVNRSRHFGQTLGWLYGSNTLGAVVGALGAELVLIKTVGMTGTAWCAAALSGTAALAALLMSGSSSTTLPVAAGSQWPRERGSRPLLVCTFLSGAALLSMEVVWARFLSLFVVSSTLSLSLILAVVLMGIGAGGLLGSGLLRWRPSAFEFLPAVAFVTAAALAASYVAFQYLAGGPLGASWERILWYAAALTLPTAFLSGALFTLVGAALGARNDNDTRVAAALTLANTLGGMVGPPVAAFVLLPHAGIERTFLLMAATYAAVGLIAGAGARDWRTKTGMVCGVAGLAALLALTSFRFGLMNSKYLPRAVEAYANDGSAIVAVREGIADTVVLMKRTLLSQPFFHRLMTNSFSMSGTQLAARRYMKYFVYWPMILHAEPLRRVLVVCYGVGVTASAATDSNGVESVDIVEISRDVLAVSGLMYSPSKGPLDNPKVHLHVEDGRNYLQTTNEQWDLITGEPPPPLTPGTVHLYTREYFRLAYEHLSARGVVTYWLPVARRGEYDIRPIIKSFCEVFTNCSLWNGTPLDWMLVGSRGSPAPLDENHFDKWWRDQNLAPRLKQVGFERPEQIGATFLGDADYLAEITRDIPPLTDDYPQRLNPRPARLSREPNADGLAADDRQLIGRVLNPARAADAFRVSRMVGELWPASLRDRTLPFFDQQRIMNRVLLDGANPLQRIGELHELLTRTSLTELPLWVLGSDDLQQEIASKGHDDGGYFIPYSRGVRALASRDYPAAAEWFAEAEQRGLRPATARPLLVYALCLAGELTAARQLSRGDMPSEPDRRLFWNWMSEHFDVGPALVRADP